MARRNEYLPKRNLAAAERLAVYDALNDDGRLYVDYIAETLIMECRKMGKAALGERGARELTIALLQHCWDGRLPKLDCEEDQGVNE